MTDDSPRRLTLEELLTLPDPAQRLVRLADLRQRPGGGGDRPGKKHGDISSYRDPMLGHCAHLRPVALEEVEHARGKVGPTDCECMLRWLGESDRFRLVLGRLGESAELGEA